MNSITIFHPNIRPSFIEPIPKGTICENCKNQKATQKWVGEGGLMGANHGEYWYWCKRCCLETQLDYAKKAAKRVKTLERELATLQVAKGRS